MLTPIVAGSLMALALIQQTDTTIAVERGARLEVMNLAGDIAVSTWDRDAVRIAAEHSDRAAVEIRSNASVVRVRADSRRGPPGLVDYTIAVPRWMTIRLNGTYSDIDVRGGDGEIVAETVRGDVVVRGGSGLVSLRSVEGAIRLENGRGRIQLATVNEGVHVEGASGEVTAETVNGDITLRAVQSGSVDAGTVNGRITYDGTIRDGGRYRFATHNGDVAMSIPESANVTVSVATFNGSFHSDFPVTQTGTRRTKRFDFTQGTGSARIDLESFNGTIHIRRPGAGRP